MTHIQKPDGQGPIKGVIEHQAKHPWLTVTLFVFLFPPAILLIIVVGKIAQHVFPEPHLWQIFIAIPFFILALVAGMLIGALLFVLVMKRFVDKSVLAPFYLYPGVPITSDLSARVFNWAYRRSKPSSKK